MARGRPSVEVIHVPEGESGRVTSLGPNDDRDDEDLVALVAGGERDYAKLGKALGMNVLSVRMALRNPQTLRKINEAVRAQATLLLPKVLECAEKDMEFGDARLRTNARNDILKLAQGPPAGTTVNSITSWDPNYDHDLWERGRQFFEDHGKRIVAETVDHVLGMEDE